MLMFLIRKSFSLKVSSSKKNMIMFTNFAQRQIGQLSALFLIVFYLLIFNNGSPIFVYDWYLNHKDAG